MTRNSTFNKAVLLLAHPFSLLALAALALNDFVLKPLAPSWITGKLSDFSLLFLLPWLGLALAAGLNPHPGQEKRVAKMVFGMIAIGYTLLKLFPLAGQLLYSLTNMAGSPLYTRPDPTDLAALLVLIPAWRLWNRGSQRRQTARAWLLLPVAALLTLADAAAPDYGITCFTLQPGQITASTMYGMKFISTDGGLTWQSHTDPELAVECEYPANDQTAVMADPSSPVQYRFQSGAPIERSADGGQTWAVEYTPARYNQVRKTYAEKTAPSNLTYKPGPLSAVEEPQSGNIVFAMGLEGVLVRKPSGQYVWANVGSYTANPEQKVPLTGYPALLFGEIVISLATGMLMFSTQALVFHQKRVIRIIKVIIGWVGWLGAVAVFPPALMTGGYSASILLMTLLVLGIYALISFLDDLIALARRRPAGLLPSASFGLLAAVFFLTPYLLWAAEVIQDYATAMIAAIAITVLVLITGLIILILNRRSGSVASQV